MNKSKSMKEILEDKMKDAQFETLYDSYGIEIQKQVGSVYSRKEYYHHNWSLKHMKKGDKVLDAGCNDGQLCMRAMKKGCTVIGIDISGKMIESAKKEVHGVEFIKCIVENMPFEDNTFDVVNANEVLEHIPNVKLALSEMMRVLKPKGRLLITVPIKKALDGDGASGHLQHWGFYEIMHLFEEYGENFKIYWISKFNQWKEDGEPFKKNLFAVKFIKDNEVNKNE